MSKIEQTTKFPWEKPDTWAFLGGLLPCVTGTSPWLLRPVKVSTSSELYPDALLFFLFFQCLGIQFFNSLTCDLQDAMSRQRSLTLLPREVEDFPRDAKHFKYVPPLTYLTYLSAKEVY